MQKQLEKVGMGQLLVAKIGFFLIIYFYFFIGKVTKD